MTLGGGGIDTGLDLPPKVYAYGHWWRNWI